MIKIKILNLIKNLAYISVQVIFDQSCEKLQQNISVTKVVKSCNNIFQWRKLWKVTTKYFSDESCEKLQQNISVTKVVKSYNKIFQYHVIWTFHVILLILGLHIFSRIFSITRIFVTLHLKNLKDILQALQSHVTYKMKHKR